MSVSPLLFKIIGYWTTITNLISCAVLALTIRFVSNLTKEPEYVRSTFQNGDFHQGIRVNLLVTSVHITLIAFYTIVSFLVDNLSPKFTLDAFYRLNTAFYFVSGLLDIFVAYMMWFLMDE